MGTLAEILGLTGGQYVTPIMPLLPGQLPTFGSGRFRLFFKNTALIIPAGVTTGRFRAIGGAGAKSENGGATSIGALLSASGGLAPVGSTGGVGGTGSGGDFQANGGNGGNTNGGGGAAGSALGNGGNGGNGLLSGDVPIGGGGGGVGGNNGGNASGNYAGGGGSAFEAGGADTPAGDLFGVLATPTWADGVMNASGAPILFPFFAFPGGGGYPAYSGPNARSAGRGGPGAGGGGGHDSGNGGFGGFGGGGGGGGFSGGDGGRVMALDEMIDPVPPTGASQWTGVNFLRSRRLIGGGAGGYRTGGISYGGAGGGGYAHGVFNLTPGDTINIIVAQPGTQSAGGLGIFEY